MQYEELGMEHITGDDCEKIGLAVLGLAPCHFCERRKSVVRDSGVPDSPRMISHFSTGVFVGLSLVEKPQAPCLVA